MSEFAPVSEIRSELKWKIELGKQAYAYQLLHDYGFKTLHPSRKVISLYFDYPSFKFFHQGEEGLVPRSKFRLRCYHTIDNLTSDSRIEVKTTGISGRTKYSLPYADADQTRIPTQIRSLYQHYKTGLLKPVSLVSYQRRYFLNEQGYRATVDMQIGYQRVLNFRGGKLITTPLARDPDGVLELKTPMALAPLEFAENIPLTRMRFSKYGQSLLVTQDSGGIRFQAR